MNPEKLKEILENHRLWLLGEGGAQADLSEANLCRADLSRADLSGADLSGVDLYRADLSGADLCRADLRGVNLYRADLRETGLFQFSAGRDQAWFCKGMLRIGCENHPIEHWLEHGEKIGEINGYTEKQIDDYCEFIEMMANKKA